MTECTGDTLAKMFEITKHRIQVLARDKRVVKLGRDRYDFYASITSYVRYLKTLEKTEQNRTIATNRQIREIALEEKKGQLVDAELMKASLQDLFLSIKGDLRSIPAGLDVAAKVRKNVATGIDRALERLSKWNLPK